MEYESDQKTNNVGYEINNSTKNLLNNLKIGLRRSLGKGFDKVGSSMIKGLNSAASLSIKTTKLAGLKMVAPIIIGVFVLIVGVNILQVNSNISGLVPRLEKPEYIASTGSSDGEGEENYGEYTNNMDKIPIPAGVIPCDLDNTSYHEELMNKVNAAGFRTRNGVAAAAKYLSSEFPYKIPYYLGGGHNSDVSKDIDGGFIDDPIDGLKRKWGCGYNDGSGNKTIMGLDCSGFVTWCYLTAGFKDWKGNPEYRYYNGSFENVYFGKTDCNILASRVKPGDVLKTDKPAHTGVILWVEGTIAKYAQSSPRGVNVEFINLCNGQRVWGSKNSFEKIVLMENYFLRNK